MPTTKRNNSVRLVLEQLSLLRAQINRRLQISGAKWNLESVNPMLQLRCAYLNGQLAF